MSASHRQVSSKLFVGLDVHKDSVVAAVLPVDASAPEPAVRLPADGPALRRFFKRVAERGPVLACYEASGAGYVLQRELTAWGIECLVIAPSLIPQRPGHQRKHDRYDAAQLAMHLRAGQLTAVRIPTAAEEAVRDLVRCRQQLQRAVVRARHQLRTHLQRQGHVYRRIAWTQAHARWLDATIAALPAVAQTVAVEYRAHLTYLLDRRDALDRRLAAEALTPALAPLVARLRAFRGIDERAALVLATEIGDWRRFASPTQLMAYVGLVPREASSGSHERRGTITKAGNGYCRHVLVQAAWSYRHRPHTGPVLAARQRDVPAPVVAHSWKAQHRLHLLFQRVRHRHPSQVAAVAVARELVGFLWAVVQDVAPNPITPQDQAA